MVTPTLAELPVYVRGGSILPIAPLTQSTMERPEGPLTLRVYAAPDSTPETCHGEIYLDDGISFNFRRGDYLRRKFTCGAKANGSLEVSFSGTEGEFRPWWREVKLEIVGWQATGKKIVGSDGVSENLSEAGPVWTATVTDRRDATTYMLR